MQRVREKGLISYTPLIKPSKVGQGKAGQGGEEIQCFRSYGGKLRCGCMVLIGWLRSTRVTLAV